MTNMEERFEIKARNVKGTSIVVADYSTEMLAAGTKVTFGLGANQYTGIVGRAVSATSTWARPGGTVHIDRVEVDRPKLRPSAPVGQSTDRRIHSSDDPTTIARRIGRGYGIDGEIWDNA